MDKQDIQNNLAFLGRVNLNGKEAMVLVKLQVKLNKMLEQMVSKETPKIKEK